jgi:ribosomal protein S18 acetylase RimI-like enzyme
MFKSETDLADGITVVRDLHTNAELAKVYLSWTPDYVIINYLWVNEDVRRRGVGTWVLNYIQQENKKRLILGTQSTNARARAFYRAVGFRETRHVRLDPESLVLERNYK